MKPIDKISSVYLVGIGGIGMSALARYFKYKGKEVEGYDKKETALTKQLQKEGIAVSFIDETDQANKSADLVVYTPAVPLNNNILSSYLQNEFEVLKRSEVLENISKSYNTIAISGTHGKTTITAMTSWIASYCGLDPTAFIGGIASNFSSNFVFGESEYIVVEADEFDRSFHRLNPNMAVISAIDADHLDIYNSLEEIQEAYQYFVDLIDENGALLVNAKLSIESICKQYSYSIESSEADFYAENIYVEKGQQYFDLQLLTEQAKNISIQMPGRHNIENVVAASSICYLLGANINKIKEAIESFTGINRRFEYVVNNDDLIIIDDYAHHPVEINALINAAKELYPNEKITIVFQPHLYSRTYDLAADFAKSLDIADDVILLPIYPAREMPIEGVNSQLIVDKMTLENSKYVEKTDLLNELKRSNPTILLIAGAGDVDAMVATIAQTLTTK